MSFAFVFPGQGAQKLNMMSGFAEVEAVKTTFAEARDALDFDLLALLNGEDAALINQTVITQPLLLTVEIAVYRAYLGAGGKVPSYLAGHSLGEYSALVAAESLALVDALRLVRKRAELMQAAVPEGRGAMAAILGLEDEAVRQVCELANDEQKGLVQAANYNSIHQVVIAGDGQAVELAMELAKQRGAKRVVPLPVSVPSHCKLMQPAAAELANFLENIEFHPPKIKVINNVDVDINTEASMIKNALVRQLYSPVRWTETILALVDLGVTEVVECAPARVLTDLAKRISKEITCTPFGSMERINEWILANH